MSRSLKYYRQTNLAPIRLLGWLVLGVVLAAGGTACSPRQVMVNEMTALMEGGLNDFESDSDLAMLKQAMPAHIKLAEAMLGQSSENMRLRILLAQLYGAYTFAFEETDFDALFFNDAGVASVVDRAAAIRRIKLSLSRHYLKGADYAKSALNLKHPGADKALMNISRRDQLLAELTQEDVPALFWYGFNLAGYVSHNLDSVKAMAMASPAEAAMQRVIALSPDYYHGTAHMVLMVFHAARPAMLGGRLETATEHYRSLKTIAGNDFILADVLYARYCLPRRQDRAAFEKMLNSAAMLPADASDSYALFNQVAAERSQIYLNAVDQLFDE